MRISSRLLRRIHKWIGLAIGLQFILWTISGAMMALLNMEQVAGGPKAPPAAASILPPPKTSWRAAGQWLQGVPVSSVTVRRVLDRHVLEIGTPAGPLLFDAATGKRVRVDAALARGVAESAYPGPAPVVSVTKLHELTLAVRKHALPIWRIDFADEEGSSYYVSASTGKLLERRNDSWRAWDFFWMLHNMDFSRRESFNHPLIVIVTFVTIWLAVTGIWLLFRTAWTPDIRALRSKLAKRRSH